MNCTSFGTRCAIQLVICCLLWYLSQAGRVTYKDYKLLRVNITNEVERDKARSLLLLGIPEFKIEVKNDYADILVSQASLGFAIGELGRVGLDFEFENIADVQQYIDSINEPHDGDFRTSYLGYKKIMEFLKELETNYSTVTLLEIGKTANNCSIPLLEISLNDQLQREIIFIELGTHAREWIAVAAGLVFIEKLAREEDPMLLEKFDFHIVPLHNVDGYIYSFDVDRLWRKNRRPLITPEDFCTSTRFRELAFGVDLNRNWGRGHRDLGFAVPPDILCRIQVNPGPYPFSEAETLAVKERLESLQDSGETVLAYFAVHNGAQVLLIPYGFTDTTPPTLDKLTYAANQMAKAMKEVDNREHGVGQIRNIFGQIGGSSLDYLYEDLYIEYPIAIELRPSIDEEKINALSFIRNETEIIPAGEELFAGIREFVEFHPPPNDLED